MHFSPDIEHTYANYKGFERALSNARKMMKFGKWLDEIEKIKFVAGKFFKGGEEWNPWLTAMEGASHILSMTYYILDNVVFLSQVYLGNVMGLYPNRLNTFEYYDPTVARTIPFKRWPSTRMFALYKKDRSLQLQTKILVQVRNVVSLSRLVLAIILELVRLRQSTVALGILKVEVAAERVAASEIDVMKAFSYTLKCFS